MSDEEKFPWIPKFDRKSGIIRVPPIIMGLLEIKKKDIFDVIIKRRNKEYGKDDGEE